MKCKMQTDDGAIIVDTETLNGLETAMRFKAENIRAKADPEIFLSVARVLHLIGMFFTDETIFCGVKEYLNEGLWEEE